MTRVPGVRDMLSEAVARTPVVWDPHPDSGAPVPGVSLATPNVRESLSFVPDIPERSLHGDIARARRLLESWKARQVALTRGEAGAVLVQDSVTAPLVVPAPRVRGADASGAGDHFDVIVASHLAAGALPSEAVTAAVSATAGHLASGGVTALADPVPASESVDDLVRRIRASGGTVVATGGCFDLLHAGHVSMLRQARELGDCLIVCLNSDVSTRGLKGPSRPVVPEEDRAAILKGLSSVDHVIIFDEDSPATVLDRLRPDIFVKGGDYAHGPVREQRLVESWGGQLVLVPYLSGHSTTELIDHVTQRGSTP
jgi:rfaE bifunctional protein nucleotidyltransferase chain/domain